MPRRGWDKFLKKVLPIVLGILPEERDVLRLRYLEGFFNDAIDELSGFIHAYSLMRPTGYEGMEVKGVKKRMKDKLFAAGVSREEIADACERAGIAVDELIAFIIDNQIMVNS